MDTAGKGGSIPEVTILIPHYQTFDAIRLCLRAIRFFTSPLPSVMVLDNGSKDQSFEYLRSVNWIRLRQTGLSNDPWQSHCESLNQAVAGITTPYFLIMHSDTYVGNKDWLAFLMVQIKRNNFAAFGCRNQCVIAKPFYSIYRLFTPVRRREWRPGIPRLRSFCALYKTEAFKKCGCRFYITPENREDINYFAHQALVSRGYAIYSLPAVYFWPYLVHLGDTTQPEDRTSCVDSSKIKRVNRFFEQKVVLSILADRALDVI
jgi:hypothetical protein